MLQIFRTSRASNLVLLFIYTALLHSITFVRPVEYEPLSTGILAEYLYGLTGTSGYIPEIFSIILLFVQAFFISNAVSSYKITYENTLFPGVFYVLVSSAFVEFLHLSPMLLGNTFLIISLIQMFEVYKKQKSANNIFNVGLWIGVASMFYFSYIIFLPAAVFGLSIIRRVVLKELLILVLGFVSVYFLAWTAFFLSDQLQWFYSNQIWNNIASFDFAFTGDWLEISKWSLYFLTLVIALIGYGIMPGRQSLQGQKNMNVLVIFIFIAFSTVFFQIAIRLEHLLVFAVPLGVILGLNFLYMKKQARADAIHLAALFIVLILQYRPF